MTDLIAHDLPAAYGSTLQAAVAARQESGAFAIYDTKSCRDCASHSPYFYRTCEPREVSRHTAATIVTVITLEDVLQQFPKIEALSKGGCCDTLMFSQSRVALMDMTCSRPEYLATHSRDGKREPGKRATAYRQIEDSITKLRGCATLSARLDAFAERLAVFAYREKLSAFDDTATRAMRSFSTMAADVKATMLTPMAGGLNFRVQRYPEEIAW